MNASHWPNPHVCSKEENTSFKHINKKSNISEGIHAYKCPKISFLVKSKVQFCAQNIDSYTSGLPLEMEHHGDTPVSPPRARVREHDTNERRTTYTTHHRRYAHPTEGLSSVRRSGSGVPSSIIQYVWERPSRPRNEYDIFTTHFSGTSVEPPRGIAEEAEAFGRPVGTAMTVAYGASCSRPLEGPHFRKTGRRAPFSQRVKGVVYCKDRARCTGHFHGGQCSGHLAAELTVIVARRATRYSSGTFYHEQGRWTDRQLAQVLKHLYKIIKLSQFGILPNFLDLRTISYVYVMRIIAQRQQQQRRRRRCKPEPHHKNQGRGWRLLDPTPITTKSGPEAREVSQNKLRHPPAFERVWCTTIDSCIAAGTVIDLELCESLNEMKLSWLLGLTVFLSLVVLVVYGSMGDFGTGFSIGAWIFTACGTPATILAAIVAAGEHFEKGRSTTRSSADSRAEERRAMSRDFDWEKTWIFSVCGSRGRV
jgi:hypothetical protein